MRSLQTHTRKAFVNSGSLMSFLASTSSQQRKDALDSTLLAQLAASKQFNRQEEPEGWYKTY